MASLSYDRVGKDRWKIRWREWATVKGKRTRVARSRTVSGKAARDELMATIRHALDTAGYWQPEARPEERVCNLEEVAVAWMKHKAARGVARSTTQVHASAMKRWFRTIRDLERLSDAQPVMGSVLNRGLVDRALLAWTSEGLSEARRYDLARMFYEMWRWAADDPETWPGLQAPPRDASTVLPLPPVRAEPPPGPTWAEMDAVLRIAADVPRSDLAWVLAVCRCTGLRVGQALGLRGADLDTRNATLVVRIGKSRREEPTWILAMPRWW